MLKQMNYFLIPGNPPARHFYDLWAKEIQSLYPEAQIHISSYPEISCEIDSAQAMTHIHHAHLANLKSFCARVKGTATIIGHSLGAYFALRLLESAEVLIKNVVFIHPFLRSPTFKGRLILKTVSKIHQLRNPLIRWRKEIEFIAQDFVHVTDEECLLAFNLASHEVHTIAVDSSAIEIAERHRSKITVFYTLNDNWCRRKVVAQLEKQVSVSRCQGPHDFIVNESHRRELSEKITSLSCLN